MSRPEPVLMTSRPRSPHLHSHPLARVLPLRDLPAKSLSGTLLHSAEIHSRHKNEKMAWGGASVGFCTHEGPQSEQPEAGGVLQCFVG